MTVRTLLRKKIFVLDVTCTSLYFQHVMQFLSPTCGLFSGVTCYKGCIVNGRKAEQGFPTWHQGLQC
jgi:hypothetical protein